MRVHPIVYFLFKYAIWLVLVLIFAGIPVSFYFLRVNGIGFGAGEALGRALSTPSIDVRIGHLALDPFSGLLASDIVIRERKNSERVLASINHISISLNLSELMQRRIVVDRLLLNRANASIPIGPAADSPRITVQDINSDIILLGDRLRMSLFDGIIEGIRIQLTGEVLNPFDYSPPVQPPGATAPDFTELAEKILSLLKETSFPDGAPLVRAAFEVDGGRVESLSVTRLSVTCGRVERTDWALKSVEIQADYTDGSLHLPVIRIHDAKGLLQASGEWERLAHSATLSLVCSLDPLPFLRAFFGPDKTLEALDFPDPPQLEADVQFDLSKPKPSVRVTGGWEAKSITYKGAKFENLACGLAWHDGRLYARDIHLDALRGSLTGNVWVAPDDLRLQMRLTIPPTDLSRLFDAKTQEFLERMEFTDTPDITLSLRAARLDFAALGGEGHLRLGRTAMRGAWIDSLEADVDIADRCLTFKDIRVTTGPGKGAGVVAYDIGRQEVRLEGIRSTLVPTDVMMWIDPRIAKTISPYRFRANPDVRVEGKVGMRGPAKNNLAIRIDSPAGMNYKLLGKTLTFGHTQAKVDVVSNTVTALITRAPLMDGDVSLKTVVSIDPKDPVFRADVKLNRVNFSDLTKLYFDYDDSKGVASGEYSFKARMGREELMVGQGSLRIEDGNVFAIPTLGPFSTILGGILPGVAYNTARLATSDFTVANKKITAPNIEIVGKGFSMFGEGDIFFLTGGLDMSMRINAQGIPGLVFFPVSKLLEYHSNGTISEPRWSPKIIPRIPAIGGSSQKKAGPR